MKNELMGKINYFTSVFLGIVGISLVYEIFSENEFADKVDDIAMLVLSGVAIWWYQKKAATGKNKWMAAILLGIGLAIKIYAIYVENDDKEAVGDDIGIVVSLVLAFLFVVWQTATAGKNK